MQATRTVRTISAARYALLLRRLAEGRTFALAGGVRLRADSIVMVVDRGRGAFALHVGNAEGRQLAGDVAEVVEIARHLSGS